jgi:hypothetical protein
VICVLEFDSFLLKIKRKCFFTAAQDLVAQRAHLPWPSDARGEEVRRRIRVRVHPRTPSSSPRPGGWRAPEMPEWWSSCCRGHNTTGDGEDAAHSDDYTTARPTDARVPASHAIPSPTPTGIEWSASRGETGRAGGGEGRRVA